MCQVNATYCCYATCAGLVRIFTEGARGWKVVPAEQSMPFHDAGHSQQTDTTLMPNIEYSQAHECINSRMFATS